MFVLTHFPREPIEMQGGTTFHFVTTGFEAALEQARAAAAGGDIDIAGGASAVRQAFARGAIDEITLDIAPVLLGRGERLFDGVDVPGLEPVEVTHSPSQRTFAIASFVDGQEKRAPGAGLMIRRGCHSGGIRRRR